MDYKFLMEEALVVLKKIQLIFPEAIIAGGFLRDLELGYQPKDMDIFIEYREGYTLDSLKPDFPSVKFENYDGMLDYISTEVAHVIDTRYCIGAVREWVPLSDNPMIASYHSPVPVQIIMVKEDMDVRERVDTFDIGLCQISHDGDILYKSPAFRYDEAFGQVTIVDAQTQEEFDRSFKRATKFADKYKFGVSITAAVAKQFDPLGVKIKDAATEPLGAPTSAYVNQGGEIGNFVN
jgi:hypothetical protein